MLASIYHRRSKFSLKSHFWHAELKILSYICYVDMAVITLNPLICKITLTFIS